MNKNYWEMNAAELADATRTFDKEFSARKSKPLSAADRLLHRKAAKLVPCSGHNYGLIGLKPARCKESAARTGFVNPLSRRDAADGRFKVNPSGGGQAAAGFVARRQRMHPYAILLASRPQPLGPPSTRNYGRNRALACAKSFAHIHSKNPMSKATISGVSHWRFIRMALRLFQ